VFIFAKLRSTDGYLFSRCRFGSFDAGVVAPKIAAVRNVPKADAQIDGRRATQRN
jgi:hypothetical protein